METQNLVISFDYSWFLAKNLAYAECRIMKFHYRNSSSPAIYAAGLFFIYLKKVKNGIVGLHFLAFYERKWLQDRAAD